MQGIFEKVLTHRHFHVRLLPHHDIGRHLSEAAGDLRSAVCMEVVKICLALGDVPESCGLHRLLDPHRDQTAVKMCEGFSFLAIFFGIVARGLQDTLDGVLVMLLA